MKYKSNPLANKKKVILKENIFTRVSAFLEKRRKELGFEHADIDRMLRNLEWSEINEELDEKLKKLSLPGIPLKVSATSAKITCNEITRHLKTYWRFPEILPLALIGSISVHLQTCASCQDILIKMVEDQRSALCMVNEIIAERGQSRSQLEESSNLLETTCTEVNRHLRTYWDSPKKLPFGLFGAICLHLRACDDCLDLFIDIIKQ